LFGLAMAVLGCATNPPPFMVGAHVDDYGSRHLIDADRWIQDSTQRYHIVRWEPSAQFLVARNDAANPADAGRWTRIDWMPLPARDGWAWAFCLAAWDAPTADSAARVMTADRSVPRRGCGGHPFTRMRPDSGNGTTTGRYRDG